MLQRIAGSGRRHGRRPRGRSYGLGVAFLVARPLRGRPTCSCCPMPLKILIRPGRLAGVRVRHTQILSAAAPRGAADPRFRSKELDGLSHPVPPVAGRRLWATAKSLLSCFFFSSLEHVHEELGSNRGGSIS
ncbi:MAG: hypothetical protein BJ554DRAFT_4910 [Olpidium bornovanus]|uniref:Uncharacterized protein n=1 Tax=Olpidium bornovanus TaxID=278681 RepID=A0A8H7ZM13_9FUNG|nr:MAG: hypothetical protein BJ554DRAFT_4910 [Olpidium bornovanus]